MIRQMKTNSLLSNRIAEIRVPKRADPNTMLVVLLFSSIIDLNWRLKPMRNPVLDEALRTQR